MAVSVQVGDRKFAKGDKVYFHTAEGAVEAEMVHVADGQMGSIHLSVDGQIHKSVPLGHEVGSWEPPVRIVTEEAPASIEPEPESKPGLIEQVKQAFTKEPEEPEQAELTTE